MSNGEPRFVSKANGVETLHRWQDVVYLTTPGAAPGRTLCLLDSLKDAISIDLAAAELQGRLLSGGARPSGVLTVPAGTKLAPETLKLLQASWNAKHDGVKNAGKTAILESGVTFTPTQFSSAELQFIDARKFAAAEIARGMKVPATLAGDLDRAVWRNVEELNGQFLRQTLLPWLECWKGALERVLFTPAERATHYLEFVVDDLLRADLAARNTAFRQAAGGAWLTRNEVRAMENRPPIDGGDELILQAGQGDQEPTPSPAPLKAVA